VATSENAGSDVVEDGQSNDALGVLASTGVVIAGGHVEKWRAEGHSARDEEEQPREGHEAESFRERLVDLEVWASVQQISSGS